jgi:hypothetical protein
MRITLKNSVLAAFTLAVLSLAGCGSGASLSHPSTWAGGNDKPQAAAPKADEPTHISQFQATTVGHNLSSYKLSGGNKFTPARVVYNNNGPKRSAIGVIFVPCSATSCNLDRASANYRDIATKTAPAVRVEYDQVGKKKFRLGRVTQLIGDCTKWAYHDKTKFCTQNYTVHIPDDQLLPLVKSKGKNVRVKTAAGTNANWQDLFGLPKPNANQLKSFIASMTNGQKAMSGDHSYVLITPFGDRVQVTKE